MSSAAAQTFGGVTLFKMAACIGAKASFDRTSDSLLYWMWKVRQHSATATALKLKQIQTNFFLLSS